MGQSQCSHFQVLYSVFLVGKQLRTSCVTVYRWLKQMGGVEEAPIINYMQTATVDPIEQMQTLQQPQLAQARMAQSQDQDEGSEGVPEEGAGGYRLTFNTSPRCFSGTNSQVRLAWGMCQLLRPCWMQYCIIFHLS